ncbi:MAG: glutamate-cysteine ligase family protein, partial [Candidatus Hodarchaeota archaeon]
MAAKDYLPKTELYFTHGIEIENHLVSRNTGEVLVGDDLLSVWEDMFDGAAQFLRSLKKSKSTPKDIARRILKVEVKEEIKRERKLKFVFITYRLGNQVVRVNVFGPDPNISQITWLLELVTPPAQYLEELDWWINTLFAAAVYGLSKTPDIALLPIGLNPTEKRVRSGLTCGEHHHIGIPKYLRIPIYNMLRNFIPHLIALSSTSPFLNQAPSGKVLIRKANGRDQIIARCIHSYRLLKNSGQMGPNIPSYLPSLSKKSTRKDFAKLVKKTPPDDRMVDLFPFTNYSTIEVRFFDAQPFKENRLALVLLLQAIAQKAKTLIDNKMEIPKVTSKCLYENRRKSVQFGLLAQFTDDVSLPNEFAMYYNYDVSSGKKASKLMHSIKSLIAFVQPELEELGSELVNFLFLPIFGTNEYVPPLSITEYLLSLYKSADENITILLSNLYYNKENNYSLKADGDYNLLQPQKIDTTSISSPTSSSLQQSLRKDLARKRISTGRVIEKPKKKKVKRPKKPRVARKKPIKVKKKIEETVPSIMVEKSLTREKKKEEKPKISPLTVATPLPTQEESLERPTKESRIISAFENEEEIEVFTPAIQIEPKYQKIESKIASAMRTRRKEIEQKRREFFKEHLKQERRPFKPKPKKCTAMFPAVVSGSEVFGFIEIPFSEIKTVMYKFRNNPITFLFKARSLKKDGVEVVTKVNTSIDIDILEKNKRIQIPCAFNLGKLVGNLTVKVKAITATNESLLPPKFSFKITRKDEISIDPKEFYITGNYGEVECVFKALNKYTKSEKGELDVFLVSQAETVPIYFTKFNLKPKEYLELARSINLSVNYQHAPFYIVSRVTVGRFSKNRAFKTIRVPILNEIIAEWNFQADPDSKHYLSEGVISKTRYEVDFVFHFLKQMPPVAITVFINTFPLGQT